jgi:hypothetical protein
MMRTVNPYYIAAYLGGLVGGADDDELAAKYDELDSNDSLAVKQVIEHELKDHFSQQTPSISVGVAKLSLQYYLTKGGVDWRRMFDSHLIPFNAPSDPRDFFVWIWEVFYPGESHLLPDTEDIIEVKDPQAPLRDALAEPRPGFPRP